MKKVAKFTWNVISIMATIYCALCLVAFVASVTILPDTSITAFKKTSHYNGDVCMIAVDKHNKPLCENGVEYNESTIAAGRSYDLWVNCQHNPDERICKYDF